MSLDLGQIILYIATAAGAIIGSLWLGIVLWTYRDARARSRDMIAVAAATLMVAILSIFGLVIYLMLRPRETLAEAYERSLEEEALLQGIEEKPVCPGCGRPSNVQWQICPHCHTRLKKPCVQCRQLLDLPWNLCPFCAAPQAASEPEPVTSQRPSARRSAAAAARSGYPALPQSSVEFVEDDEV